MADDSDQSGGSDKCWDEALDELDRVNAEAEAEKACGASRHGSSESSSSSSSSSSGSTSSSSTKRAKARGPRAQPSTLLPNELRKLLPKEGAGGEITIYRMPESYGYRVMYPSGDRPHSCSRQWPTRLCPTELDALKKVMEFAYWKWNALHGADRQDQPSGQLLRDYVLAVNSLSD
mmetsp:Transcript_61069/g.133722  ORF Transcript_61069/g.133722 Transcript_61069/m.133722 type:complete len:176 (+) Transcript_61069:440-967(+)